MTAVILAVIKVALRVLAARGHLAGTEYAYLRQPRPAHEITLWVNPGTGRGDDMDGWRCTCGKDRLHDHGLVAHRLVAATAVETPFAPPLGD